MIDHTEINLSLALLNILKIGLLWVSMIGMGATVFYVGFISYKKIKSYIKE